jgi:hypothetical protein
MHPPSPLLLTLPTTSAETMVPMHMHPSADSGTVVMEGDGLDDEDVSLFACAWAGQEWGGVGYPVALLEDLYVYVTMSRFRRFRRLPASRCTHIHKK